MEISPAIMGAIALVLVGAVLLTLYFMGYFTPGVTEYTIVKIKLTTTGVILEPYKTSREPFVVIPDLTSFIPALSGDGSGGSPYSVADPSPDASHAGRLVYNCTTVGTDNTHPYYQLCNDTSPEYGYQNFNLGTTNEVAGVIMQEEDYPDNFTHETDVNGPNLTNKDTALVGPLVGVPQSMTLPTCYPHKCRVFKPEVKDDNTVVKFADIFTGEDITSLVAKAAFSNAKVLDDKTGAPKARLDYILHHYKVDTNTGVLTMMPERFSTTDVIKVPEPGIEIRPGKHFSGPEIVEIAAVLALKEFDADGIELDINYKMESAHALDAIHQLSTFFINQYGSSTAGAGGT
jgi:hypothetical protein